MGLPWWLSGKESACQCRRQVGSLGHKDSLEKEMATHSSILAWETWWTEKPGMPQSVGLQRVRHDLVTKQHYYHVLGRGDGFSPTTAPLPRLKVCVLWMPVFRPSILYPSVPQLPLFSAEIWTEAERLTLSLKLVVRPYLLGPKQTNWVHQLVKFLACSISFWSSLLPHLSVQILCA